jgi:thiol-disulfide isomerase/thioredoxin
MIKTIKSIVLPTFFAVFILTVFVSANEVPDIKGETKVYYFHNNRRCPTCLAIEKEVKNVLKEEPFAGAKENGELTFRSYNAENVVNKKLVKELGVTGSALIILQDGKKTDLTSKGFMYALKQPEKFRQALREALSE